MDKMNEALILASSHLGKAGIDTFWGTSAGKALGAVLGVVGILVLLGAGFKAFKSFADGKTGAGVKILLGGGVLAAILISPGMLTSFAELAGKLFSLVVESGGQLIG